MDCGVCELCEINKNTISKVPPV
uniref:Uncharacterized protein n=1 Tax=Arundo donax TaxID=35708 RepID=A0A0A9BSQ5_ARUDO